MHGHSFVYTSERSFLRHYFSPAVRLDYAILYRSKEFRYLIPPHFGLRFSNSAAHHISYHFIPFRIALYFSILLSMPLFGGVRHSQCSRFLDLFV